MEGGMSNYECGREGFSFSAPFFFLRGKEGGGRHVSYYSGGGGESWNLGSCLSSLLLPTWIANDVQEASSLSSSSSSSCSTMRVAQWALDTGWHTHFKNYYFLKNILCTLKSPVKKIKSFVGSRLCFASILFQVRVCCQTQWMTAACSRISRIFHGGGGSGGGGPLLLLRLRQWHKVQERAVFSCLFVLLKKAKLKMEQPRIIFSNARKKNQGRNRHGKS